MSHVMCLLLGACLTLTAAIKIRYDNYHVYNVTARDTGQLKILQELDEHIDSVIFLDGVYSTQTGIHILVAPHKVSDFEDILTVNNISIELEDGNAQARIERIEQVHTQRLQLYNWIDYNTLDETYYWMRSLADTYPKEVSVIVAGKSYEGRDILGVKISYKSGNKGIFIESGIHAREWIAPAVVTYLINELLTSTNSDIRKMAEENDWYIIPHTNPDGYLYTWTTDRIWRKNRRPHRNCYGVDPNRNWDYHWNEIGASQYPCSEIYSGPSAFSETETKSLSKYILSLRGRIHLYLSFHAYSQLLLYPYGYASRRAKNIDDVEAVYKASIAAIRKRYETKYHGGNIYDAVSPVSGSSIDWAYAIAGIKLAYCYELRPYRNDKWYGFALPPDQIIPTAEETVDSLVAMVEKAKELNYL